MNLIVNSELFEAFTKVLHYLKIHKIDYIKTNDIKMIVKPTQTKKLFIRFGNIGRKKMDKGSFIRRFRSSPYNY